jgi:hypothetical protein
VAQNSLNSAALARAVLVNICNISGFVNIMTFNYDVQCTYGDITTNSAKRHALLKNPFAGIRVGVQEACRFAGRLDQLDAALDRSFHLITGMQSASRRSQRVALPRGARGCQGAP